MAQLNAFNSQDKILHHLTKVDRYINGHKTLVVTELDLTNNCNNNCPECVGTKETAYELSREQIDRVVDGLAELENKGVILSGGGDPLMSPHFEYALERIARTGMRIGLNSNGFALDERKAQIIAKYCDYFRVSLDAASPELYRKTHGMGTAAFEQTVENCRMFARVKKETGSSINFGVGFLTSDSTRHEMSSFVELAKEIGCNFAQFRPFENDLFDATESYLGLKEKYDSESFSVLASVQKYSQMKVAGERSYNQCNGMFFSTVITANAKVFACLHYRQSPKHEIGTIGELSLPEIWKSSRKWQVFESIDCASCPKLCRNDAFNRTLDTLLLDITNIEFL